MSTEAGLGMSDQCFGFVRNALDYNHRERLQCGCNCVVPSLSIASFCILFEYQEVRYRFDGHQTDLWVKRLVLAESDFAFGHLLCKALVFLIAEQRNEFFEIACDSLLRSVGCSDESVQETQL